MHGVILGNELGMQERRALAHASCAWPERTRVSQVPLDLSVDQVDMSEIAIWRSFISSMVTSSHTTMR